MPMREKGIKSPLGIVSETYWSYQQRIVSLETKSVWRETAYFFGLRRFRGKKGNHKCTMNAIPTTLGIK